METTTQRGDLCSVFLVTYKSGDQTKKKQMGSACASWAVVRDDLEKLCVGRRIILK